MMDDMIDLPGGAYRMGSDDHYPEEAPARTVIVDPFSIDRTPVTNAQFARFVDETGYITTAETPPRAEDYPGADPAMLQAGSSLFVPTAGPVPLHNPLSWWQFSFGTDWCHPWGPQSDIAALADHPVTHVSYYDAAAYAQWTGKQLPTEAEWEFAARGGLDSKAFAWGDELEPDGQHMANIWQGEFPWGNTQADGFMRTSPVRHYPANGYGLFDMIGNIWEWTEDWYGMDRSAAVSQPCCTPRNPRGGSEDASRDLNDPGAQFGRKVLKGGSHLCAPSYCQRYRPAARYPQTVDTSTSHIDFRCVRRPE